MLTFQFIMPFKRLANTREFECEVDRDEEGKLAKVKAKANQLKKYALFPIFK